MANTIEHYRAYAYGDSLFQLRSSVPMVKDGESTWIHIAPFGEWKGHEKGSFVLNEENMDTIIANHNKQISPSMVDYEHDSLDKDKPGPKLAAGWIQKLEKRPDGLWAFVEFVKKAVDYIKAGEIKFVSPAIRFRSEDRKTNKNIGPELVNIALTNMPFLDGLNPIELKRLPMANTIKTTESTTVEKPAQLELSDDTMQAQDETVDATAAVEAIAAAAGLDLAAAVAALLDKQEEVAAVLVGSAEQEGSEAETEEATDNTAGTVAATVVAGETDKAITAMSRKIDALEKEKEARSLAEITAKVEAKIEGGYIPDIDKPVAIWMFQHEPEKAEVIYKQKRIPIDVTQATQEDGKDTVYKLSDLTELEQKNVVSMQGMSKAAGRKMTQEKAIANVVASRNSN